MVKKKSRTSLYILIIIVVVLSFLAIRYVPGLLDGIFQPGNGNNGNNGGGDTTKYYLTTCEMTIVGTGTFSLTPDIHFSTISSCSQTRNSCVLSTPRAGIIAPGSLGGFGAVLGSNTKDVQVRVAVGERYAYKNFQIEEGKTVTQSYSICHMEADADADAVIEDIIEGTIYDSTRIGIGGA